jgi:hypothetical protein
VLHRRPVGANGGIEIGGDGVPDFAASRAEPLGEAVERRRGAGLDGDAPLGLVELLPYDQHREGEQHGVEHPDDGELEPGHLVVAAQPLERYRAPDENRSEHREQGPGHQEQEARDPDGGGGEHGHGALAAP